MRLLTLLLAATTTLALADEPKPPLPEVRIDVLMISLPTARALEFLPGLRDAAKSEGACAALEQMMAHNEAKLIAWPEVVTKSGQRAVTEDIIEERYATEFDLPKSPSDQTPKPRPPDVFPTSFETRNTGATLEVEPIVTPDGKAVHLSIVPQYVRLLEMRTLFTGKNSAGEELKVDQPQFRAMKTTTSFSLRSGQRQLLATFHNAADGALVLFIVRAVVLPTAP